MIRPTVIATLGFVAAVLAAVLALSIDRDESADVPPPIEGPLPKPPLAGDTRLPAVDVIRVGKGGDAVIAGRAEPQAIITLFETSATGQGRDLGQAVADSRGEWVFDPELPFQVGAWRLGIRASTVEGRTFRGDTVVLLLAPGSDLDLAVALPNDQPLRFLDGLGGDLPPAMEGTAAKEASPPASDADSGSGSPPIPRFVLLAVEALSDGRLIVDGRGVPGASLHLYLDDRFVGRARANQGGWWRMVLHLAVAPGPHDWRADQVGEQGRVVARVEQSWQFQAENPPILPDIQRMDHEWRIVRDLWDGTRSRATVFVAAREQVRDTATLHQGQVFSVTEP